MAQQTAVEWLEIQFEKYTSGGVNVPNNKIFKLTGKAKEIEKQQIIKAYKAHHDLGHIYGLNSEQYYKETYEN